MEKVVGCSFGPNFVNTPSVVGGKAERFGDIHVMISRWEVMDTMVLGGVEEVSVRKEVRRRSERNSELLTELK